MSVSKKNTHAKGDRGKGIEFLSEVTLTEDAQFEEVRKKSLRDFHRTHPSGSGAAKIKPFVTNEGTGAKPRVPDVIEEELSESSDQENDSGDDNTQSDNEKGSDSKHELIQNEEELKMMKKKMRTSLLEPRLTILVLMMKMKPMWNQRVKTKLMMRQFKEGTDVEMTNIQQGNENLEITLDQVIEDAHVTISTVAKKTKVPVTSSSHSSNLAAKFLNFADIPTTEAEIVSPIDCFLVSALEKEVSELRMDDPLNTQVTALVDEHLESRLGATKDEFMNYLLASITARITEQVKI
ncbi:hypothetical protein Tco_0965514 [Tanacetum coccineum]